MPRCDHTDVAGLSECSQLSTAPVTPQTGALETFAGRLILSWPQSFVHLLWMVQTCGQVCTPPVWCKWFDKPLANWLETSGGTPRRLGAWSIPCTRSWVCSACRHLWGDLSASSATSCVRRQSQALGSAQRGCEISILGAVQNLTEHGHEHPLYLQKSPWARQEAGLEEFQRSLPTQVTLWFCFSHKHLVNGCSF